MTFDKETIKQAGKSAKSVIQLEWKTEPGRINSIGLALGFLLLVLISAQNSLEAIFAGFLPHGHAPDFPWLPVIAIYLGCVVACVVALGLLAAFVQNDSQRK